MAQSDKIKVKGTELTLKPTLEKDIEIHYNQDTISIVNLLDANVDVTGTVTGKKYIWHGAGTAQDVDVRDADEILNKKRGRACCGGDGGTSVFQLA